MKAKLCACKNWPECQSANQKEEKNSIKHSGAFPFIHVKGDMLIFPLKDKYFRNIVPRFTSATLHGDKEKRNLNLAELRNR